MSKNKTQLKHMKNEILNFMTENEKNSFFVNEISDGLKKNTSDEFKEVVKALASLERDRKINLTEDGQFKLLADELNYVGKFSGTERGFGFVTIPDFEKDVFISPDDIDTALTGDTVRIEITKDAQPWNDRAAEGEITEIIERDLENLVGEFQAYTEDEIKDYNLYGYVTPNNRKLRHLTIQIGTNGLRPVDGQIIMADITQYPRYKDEDLIGIATKIIGHKNDPGVDILAIAFNHGIDPEFPQQVLDETEAIPDKVQAEEMEGRKDLRGQKTVTIDGEDAKDLDDAIIVEKLDNGHYKLGVHIADVSHYVREGTALNEEAFKRGTSSYLIDRVIPMLPPKLSNGVCSLHPGADRLALSCDMEFNTNGKLVNYDIYPSVIQSYRRLSYKEVNGILMDENPTYIEKQQDLHEMMLQMQELHEILENKRVNNGAISFDSSEVEFKVDEEGKPLEIKRVERGVGERMIESFMLAANETVSAHFTKRHLPILYRVHEQPDIDKMQNFIEFASALGLKVKGQKDKISPKSLQSILDQVKGEPTEQVVNMLMLRSMQKARYDVQPLGHYGLATEFYSHFTAPIRRYPDLILHRLIHTYHEEDTSKKVKAKWEEKLPEIAEHSSIAERRAIDAEREVEDLKMAEYMADKVGQKFEGLITSITNFGMFVQVEEAVEGLVHMSTMKNDYYEFNERGMILIGQRTGDIHRIGETVEVELVNVNVKTYDIDFELVGNSTKDNNKKKQNKKKPKDHKKGRNKDFKITRDKKKNNKRKHSRQRNRKRRR